MGTTHAVWRERNAQLYGNNKNTQRTHPYIWKSYINTLAQHWVLLSGSRSLARPVVCIVIWMERQRWRWLRVQRSCVALVSNMYLTETGCVYVLYFVWVKSCEQRLRTFESLFFFFVRVVFFLSYSSFRFASQNLQSRLWYRMLLLLLLLLPFFASWLSRCLGFVILVILCVIFVCSTWVNHTRMI